MNGKGVVVVVETDDLIRGLLERWLGDAGYTAVAMVEEGARSAKAARPVLVIANVSNPRGAPALIRSLQATYAAPILVLSARFRRAENSAQTIHAQGVAVRGDRGN